jgi:isoleucyl-tRNA synthetase
MKSPFSKVPAQVDFAQEEHAILALWQKLDAFAESNRRREGQKPPFVFYDGPPFATGTPHYGHLLAGTIKDIVPRFWNMRGHPVPRRFGWDCHGLPIEALAQQALGLAGTASIVDHGVAAFNEKCRSMVQTYVAEWRRTVTRMGRWVDFDDDYKTMDPDFMESVWWVFKRLWEQGRVYKSYRIMPYSWALSTPLSNFEANANYKDVQDPAITVRFPLRTLGAGALAALGAEAEAALLAGQVNFLAWTTTPWTLPSNLALAVGSEIPYVAVKVGDGDAVYVLADSRLAATFKKEPVRILARFVGADLVGSTYEPLFPYYAERAGCFRVLAGSFVTTDDGTGIVHLAPAYGEDDFAVCQEAGIELVDPLDAEGRFTAQVHDYQGINCKEADRTIISDLKQKKKLVHHDTIVHSYPFDERTDTPLIYRAIEAWYVRVSDLRADLVRENDGVGWVPEAIGKNRFGNWLRDASDWNISRNRFWGSCIPIWVNRDDPADVICVGSIAELEQLSGVRVTDLHKHIVDPIVIHKDDKTYHRTPEVLDCWFESGAMPYAQQHYPFEPGDDGSGHDARIAQLFPAHFIAEGLDQTRGWFYTLLVLGTALFGRAPYQNVIVNGLILAEDGQKMSKRKKNYADPNETLEKYGADALRAYLIDSPVVRGEPLRFSEKGLTEILRTVVLPYWNALSFFTTYASLDGFDPRDPAWASVPAQERPEGDRWILSVLQSLIRDVNREMEGYRLFAVVPRLVHFIDDLTNWYIRLGRPRFWKSQNRDSQAAAYHTLLEVLTTFARVLAPFMPFITENIHQRLVVSVDDTAPASIHFCDYPIANESLIDATLEQGVTMARSVVALGRRLREEHRIKVRQPLTKLTVVHRDAAVRAEVRAQQSIILAELNLKSLELEADEGRFARITVKPNFATLGKRCGKKLGAIKKGLEAFGATEVARLEAGETIEVEGEAIALGDVLLQRDATGGGATATDGRLTVVLDTQLTPALVAEGHAREVVSQLQNARKGAGLEVSDRIQISYFCSDPAMRDAIEHHKELILAEVLGDRLSFAEHIPEAAILDVNGTPVQAALSKV